MCPAYEQSLLAARFRYFARQCRIIPLRSMLRSVMLSAEKQMVG